MDTRSYLEVPILKNKTTKTTENVMSMHCNYQWERMLGENYINYDKVSINSNHNGCLPSAKKPQK